MNNVTKKWVLLKISTFILIPLMTWFIINLVNIYDKEYLEVLKFFSGHPSKFLVTALLIIAFLNSTLSISEIFEDYIHDKKIKNVANKTLKIFSIIIPLITIIIIFYLSI
jgi:succinate dehydrogenase / fumarate reductase membrane anchor subunit